MVIASGASPWKSVILWKGVPMYIGTIGNTANVLPGRSLPGAVGPQSFLAELRFEGARIHGLAPEATNKRPSGWMGANPG